MARKKQVVRIYKAPAGASAGRGPRVGRQGRPPDAAQPLPLKPLPLKPLHLKRRALADLLPLGGAVFLTHALLPGMDDLSLTATFGVFLLGIALYLARRNADFARFADRRRQLAERTEGLGVSLADWHKGARLLPWEERVAGKASPASGNRPPGPATPPTSATDDSTRASSHESL